LEKRDLQDDQEIVSETEESIAEGTQEGAEEEDEELPYCPGEEPPEGIEVDIDSESEIFEVEIDPDFEFDGWKELLDQEIDQDNNENDQN
jgi:hypothetical protein